MTPLPQKAAILTLGCRLNQADAALMADNLRRHGFEMAPWGTAADLLVVNSCTVTATAAAKTRRAVRAARRRFPHAYLVVAGCDVELSADAWLAEGGVDLIVGNTGKTRLGELLPPDLARERVQARLLPLPGQGAAPFLEEGTGLFPERTRAHLKIQEGCDHGCSYCIVPRVRGAARSRIWDDVLREAGTLLERGYREIVLTGVNIAEFRAGARDLADLVRALLALDQGFRIRLSSTEPGAVIPRIAGLMREEPRLCPFLHLPLQHADNRILAAMNRRLRFEAFAELTAQVRETVPGIGLGTDLIVGFPGETDEIFAACCENIRRTPVHHLHVFSFSPRAGAPAAALDGRVRGDVAAQRAAILTRIGREKARAFAASQTGRTVTVLTEERDRNGAWQGWSGNYLRVHIESRRPLIANQFVPVRIRTPTDGRHVAGVEVLEGRSPAGPVPVAPREQDGRERRQK
ncbi:MAG: tRNA (N(6)-L-threonylcarbamoyladenosine(37)-C(2))-methylthiotransferase MtaB [Lentisphaeria bacterium]|nr:tRNA (N(6)-L-threonylcarbamoyladenosine(37)-C(2))-methylthiotransferase MtaB [Lentisphaeria bacterium]